MPRSFWTYCVVAVVLPALGCTGDSPSTTSSREGEGQAPESTLTPTSTGTAANEIPGGRIEGRPALPSVQTAGAPAPAEVDADECSAVTKSAEVQPALADIVWVIDGSPSMVDETAAVQMNIANFASDISAAGIDHHVIMVASGDVAASTPLSGDAEHYRYVPALVDSHNALQILLDVYPSYSDFLRPEASLHFIVVTDDNAFTAHGSFKDQMEALANKRFLFHAIASEDAPGGCIGACGLPLVCGAFAPGVEYYALSDLTGGQKISICTADWSQVFGPLKDAVIASAPLPCDYAIPAPPTGETLDPDRVNMEFVAQGSTDPIVVPRAATSAECTDSVAWFYDDPDAPSALKLCPAACDRVQAGGTVDIGFGCETVPLHVD